MNEAVLYYFGCIGQASHYLHYSEKGRAKTVYRPPPEGMSQALYRALDGTFCPPESWPTQSYQESHVGP